MVPQDDGRVLEWHLDPVEAEGMSSAEILSYFYDSVDYERAKKGWKVPFDYEGLRGLKLDHDLINAKTNRVIADAGTKLTPRLLRDIEKKGIDEHVVPHEEIIGR